MYSLKNSKLVDSLPLGLGSMHCGETCSMQNWKRVKLEVGIVLVELL